MRGGNRLMKSMLISAVVLVTIALILYTWNIFGLRKQLLKKHVIGLSIAWCCDLAATILFFLMGRQTKTKATPIFIFHTWLGYLALVLMLILVILVIRQWRKSARHLPASIRSYALLSWVIWLIDYLAGMMVR